MAIPDNWTLVPVRGRFLGSNGQPVSGQVSFTPRAPRLVNAEILTTIIGTPVAAQLDANGAFSILLPAGDDPDLTPTNFTYTVNEIFTGGRTYDISVPLAKAEEGIELAIVAPAPPNTGSPATAVTRLEFNSLSASVSTLTNAVANLGGSIVVSEDELLPLGTPANTVVYRTAAKPSDIKVTHVSNNKAQPITNFELPDKLAIGDVVIAIAATIGAGRSFTWSGTGWTEIFDYSQQRTTSAAIYRIPDQAALDAIVTPTITPSGNFDSMVLATLKIDASTAPWAAYGAGNGRSPNTFTAATNTGFSVNQISSSPFASFDTEFCFGAAYSANLIKGPAPVITLPVGFTSLVDATTGGFRFVMGKRPGSTLPIAPLDFGVTHVEGHENALYGGAHFIVPKAA